MSSGDGDKPEVMWAGKYIRAIKRGRWEYASRTRDIRAVVILAEIDGKIILIDQPRVPIGKRCLELPAGLVGDEDEKATVEDTAIKELEEETGYTATHIERLGDFYSSPGMVAEGFTLVRATGLTKIGDGGGTDSEDITIHLVARDDIPALVQTMRGQGVGIDSKIALFLDL
ncbi:MAG: NUDIX hydrolase [Sphingomicrobium sp.]